MAKKNYDKGVEVSYRKGEYFYERLHILSIRANELVVLVNSGRYEFARQLFSIAETLYGHVRYYVGKSFVGEFKDIHTKLLTYKITQPEYRYASRELVELYYSLEDKINEKQLNIPYESRPDEEELKEKAKRRFR